MGAGAPRNPHALPTKTCPVCGRAFVWRKKWERDWPTVIYCSERCRRNPPRALARGPKGGAS